MILGNTLLYFHDLLYMPLAFAQYKFISVSWVNKPLEHSSQGERRENICIIQTNIFRLEKYKSICKYSENCHKRCRFPLLRSLELFASCEFLSLPGYFCQHVFCFETQIHCYLNNMLKFLYCQQLQAKNGHNFSPAIKTILG